MVLPIILGVAGAVFGAASVIQGVKAARSSRNAQRIQRDADNLRAAQERRRTIRDGRIRQAAAEQNAWNQGVGTSSGASGGQGSIITQMNSNVSFIDDQQTAARISGQWLDKASSQTSASQMWGSFSNLAFMGAQSDFAQNFGKTDPAGAVAPTPSWQKQLQNNNIWRFDPANTVVPPRMGG